MKPSTPFLCLLFLWLPWPAAAAQDGGSTFGHARTRELAELGELPRPNEVAVADLVNYHRHRLPLPRAGEPLALDVRFGGAVAAPGGRAILQIGIATASAGDRRDLPPVNLALVIDCSGSMADAGKLDAVKAALAVLAGRLRPDDRVALVAYADEAEVVAESRRRGDGEWLRKAIERLRPGGITNLHAGLMLGLREAGRHRSACGQDRVLLLTDGIANCGETDPETILRDAREATAGGIDLSTIGVGRDLNVDLLDRLARGARGLFHFVADARDVGKVFVQEFESQLAAVARRVRLELDLPVGLELVRVYGHEWRREDGAVVVDLPDLGAGATAVVLAECRLRARGDELEDVDAELRGLDERGARRSLDRVDAWPLWASARLVYRAAGSDGGDDAEPRVVAARAALHASSSRDDRERGALADAEVRKNYTIAVLAQGLHDMATHAACSRWAEAERCVRAAVRFAREQFPNVEDPDLRRVLEMAEEHARTVRRHVDRFALDRW